MKRRTIFIAVTLIVVVVVGVFAAKIKQSAKPSAKPSSDEEFIEEIRDKIVTEAPEAIPAILEKQGTLPPVIEEAEKVAVIELEMNTYDMGTISNSEKSIGQVMIYNKGNADLIISKIKTTCGCTKGRIKNKVIPPGGEEPIIVTIDPFKIRGFESQKTLTISSNDANNPKAFVRVKVKILPEYAVEPKELKFGELEKGQTRKLAIDVRQLSDEPLEIKGVTVPGGEGIVEFDVKKKPEKEWAHPDRAEYFILAKVSPDAPVGRQNKNFDIQTNLKRMPKIRGSYKLKIKAFYSYSPRNIPLPNEKPGAIKKGVFKVSGDRPFEVVDIKGPDDDLIFTTRPGDEPFQQIVDMEISPEAEIGQKIGHVSFTIKDGDKEYKEKITIRGTIVKKTD